MSGNITSSTIWAIAGSPYIVVGTVRVLEGAILTIEPGVAVKLNDALIIIRRLVNRQENGIRQHSLYF